MANKWSNRGSIEHGNWNLKSLEACSFSQENYFYKTYSTSQDFFYCSITRVIFYMDQIFEETHLSALYKVVEIK